MISTFGMLSSGVYDHCADYHFDRIAKMNENEARKFVQTSLWRAKMGDATKRWIPEHISTQIYRCLRDIYPYEKEIVGTHPVHVREMEGMYVIRLYDDIGYMRDMEISIHQLIDQNRTRQPIVHEFLGLMREALNTQDKQRNGETP